MKRMWSVGSATVVLVFVEALALVAVLVWLTGRAQASPVDGEFGFAVLGVPILTAFRHEARIGMTAHPGLILVLALPLCVGLALAVAALRSSATAPRPRTARG